MEKKEHGEGCCDSMMCSRGCQSHGHHLIKMILKLIIIGIIFCYAYKLGEINGSLRAAYYSGGYGMMHRGGGEYGGMMRSATTDTTKSTEPAPTQAQ